MAREIGLAAAIRIVRRARGMTQARLALAAGMSRESVNRIERAGDAVWDRRVNPGDLIRVLAGDGAADVDLIAEASELEGARAVERRATGRAHSCDRCGRALAQTGRGRPRKRHARCAPRGDRR